MEYQKKTLDGFTKREVERLTESILNPRKRERGCPGWLLLRLPPEVVMTVDSKENENRLYAQIRVASFTADDDEQPFYINGHTSIWGNEELPPCPAKVVQEYIEEVIPRIIEKWGTKDAQEKHIAFRVRLYTVPWNGREGNSWCFALDHENGKGWLDDIYDNDFLGMMHDIRTKLRRECGVYSTKYDWGPHIRIYNFTENEEQAQFLSQHKGRTRSISVRRTRRTLK